MLWKWPKFSIRPWSKADTIAAVAAATAIVVTFLNYELWQETRRAVAAANMQAEYAKRTYEADLRPRITPTGARLRNSFIPDKPLEIEIAYRNMGKEPAIISTEHQQYAVARFTKSVSGMADDIPTFVNETCPAPSLSEQGLVVHPGLGDYTSIFSVPARVWQDALRNDTTLLYITGCLTYQRSGMSYRSAYCFYLRPDKTNDQVNWQFLFCGDGNFAD